MEDYKRQKRDSEQGFKRDLLALLRKYNACIEISLLDNYVIDVDVEILPYRDDEGNLLHFYSHFELPLYMDGDTKL